MTTDHANAGDGLTPITLHHVQRAATPLRRVITPVTVGEALAVLDQYGDRAKPMAGGTDLLIELDRAEHSDVEVFVDLTRIAGLSAITAADASPDDTATGTPGVGRITIGALVTHAACGANELIRRRALPLAQACLEVGSPQLRNRATVVGNLVTASPANDTISALAVLNADVTVESVGGTRVVPLSAFHLGVRRTVLEANELVTAVTFDALGDEWRALYLKLGLRRSQAISVVHLALALRLDDDRMVSEARLAVGSVAPTIVRSAPAEAALVGATLDAPDPSTATSSSSASATPTYSSPALPATSLDGAVIDRVAELAVGSVAPIDDLRAGAGYRNAMVAEMVRRALIALAAGTQADALPPRPVLLADPDPDADADAGAGYQAADHEIGSVIESTVNDRSVAGPAAGSTLLDWLRDRGLTGTKEGCGEGECGACTIHLDGKAVLSCLIPDTGAHRASVTTVEGVADRHPELQAAFVAAGGVQCGYCIPGFIMSAAKLLDERPPPPPGAFDRSAGDATAGGSAGDSADGSAGDDATATIKAALAGNLCRCTGYYKIEDAVRRCLVGPSPGPADEGSDQP